MKDIQYREMIEQRAYMKYTQEARWLADQRH